MAPSMFKQGNGGFSTKSLECGAFYPPPGLPKYNPEAEGLQDISNLFALPNLSKSEPGKFPSGLGDSKPNLLHLHSHEVPSEAWLAYIHALYAQQVESPVLEDVPMPTKLTKYNAAPYSVQPEDDLPQGLPLKGNHHMPTGYTCDAGANATQPLRHRFTPVCTGVPAAPREMSECTLVVRCLPKCSQHQLLQLWSSSEYLFNFLFLPFCEKRRRSVSYCFINFIHYEAAMEFQSKWSDTLLSVRGLATQAESGNGRTVCIDVAELQGFIPNVLNAGEQIKSSRVKEKHPPAVFDLFGNPKSFFDTLAHVSLKPHGTDSGLLSL